MGIIKTRAEYDKMKIDILKKIDNFIYDYNEFTRKTNSKYWRVCGELSAELNNIKGEIPRFKPLNSKELSQSWIRDEILTDEEKIEYENIIKYNL
jgi:hypothetical protein